jgi:hypothetical protein
MSVTWTLPDVAEHEYGKPPSIWWCVIAFVVIQVAGIVLTVLDWEPGTPVMSGTFFVRALLLPLLMWGLVCSVIHIRYEEWIERVDWWNFLCREARADWRQWAQAHVAIVGSVALTPEPELAERLLGLEGSPPMNPGKLMPLPEAALPAGESRIGLILEQLVMPFAGRIARVATERSVEVLLHSDDAQDENALRAIWRKLGLPDLVQIGWAPLDGKTAKVDHWFTDRWKSDFQLLLACQLHVEAKEPSCSEAAVAMLLASPKVVADFRGKLKPQARLFRPISRPSDSVEDALETLLAAEQTPRARIRHLWLSGLPRQGHHATAGAVKQTGLNLPAHDVDHAIGKPGPVNALLLQALATQMVEHGQGAQLVASPGGQGVMLNLVGTQLAPVPHVDAGHVRLLGLSATIGTTCGLVLIMFLLEAAGASSGWFWACIAGLVLLLPLQIGGSILKRRLLEDAFYRQLRRSRART